ncbi:MAG: hypothetical protein JWM04_430 [Verrucomicrobiales bacterium]|nr:hypothetical protein [Verrucomicrobiales bacterium]
MKPISTKTHGFLDYATSLVLVISPALFGFGRGHSETWVPVALGVGALIYSLATDYELGAVRILSMKNHLRLDFVNGLLLGLSPWLFGFAGAVFVPHVVMGAFEVLAALLTREHANPPRAAKGHNLIQTKGYPPFLR